MTNLTTRVGDLSFRSPIFTASGTAGHGDELADYGELDGLGAIVTKSLSAFPFDGNPPPRLATSGAHMVNAVGLAGPGIAAWRAHDLPALLTRSATVVGSIWGRTTEEFRDAAEAMRGAEVVALEVNASCPNLESRREIFAHSPTATAALVEAAKASGLPRWVKLSPNTPLLLEVAGAAIDAGADALVLVNTVLGLVIDVEARRPTLGNVGGGVSGAGILPVALRAVFECRAAFPAIPIVGVGGVAHGVDAVSMLMAGANAVEVGTATFADPRAPWRIQRELNAWLDDHDISHIDEVIGAAHG
jgi:dihydroorotate dehydrogenase (NAD+) catalytic subunit